MFLRTLAWAGLHGEVVVYSLLQRILHSPHYVHCVLLI